MIKPTLSPVLGVLRNMPFSTPGLSLLPVAGSIGVIIATQLVALIGAIGVDTWALGQTESNLQCLEQDHDV